MKIFSKNLKSDLFDCPLGTNFEIITKESYNPFLGCLRIEEVENVKIAV